MYKYIYIIVCSLMRAIGWDMWTILKRMIFFMYINIYIKIYTYMKHVYMYMLYILDISSGRKDHFISKFIGGSITTCFVLVHSSDAGGGMMLWIFLKFVDFFQGWLEDFQSLSLKKILFHITICFYVYI